MQPALYLAAILLLPLAPAAAGPILPKAPAVPGSVDQSPPVMQAQYRVYDYYQPAPVPQLREFIDRDGNRVFVNEFGEVVSVVPPVERQPREWGRREQREWGVRRPDRGAPGGGPALQAPPEHFDRHGGDDSVPGEPDPGGEPRQQDAGPKPYTPPSIAEEPSAEQPTVASNEGTAEVAALQVLLDRAGASPGVIDGQIGTNVRKAMEAYERVTGKTIDPDDIDAIMEELRNTGGLPIQQYTITEEDVAGPFIASVPADYAEKAELEELPYTSPAELIAERFHMDEGYLRAINQNADFFEPGTVIKVANVGMDASAEVARIVADKGRKQVLAYDATGDLIAAYPATIGSRSTPSPTGRHEVERVAYDPNYTYNPKINFQQGDNDAILTIPPGPNGPVGSIWIALSKPTYGIHGTPDPAKIGKTESNGCVRLTNWDARELADMVEPGVIVEFVDETELLVSERDDEPAVPAPQ